MWIILDFKLKKKKHKQEYNDANHVISNGHPKKGEDFLMTTSYQGYGFTFQLR